MSASLKTQYRIAITTGEPAGIGPELMYHLTQVNLLKLPLFARCAYSDQNLKQNKSSICKTDPQTKVQDFLGTSAIELVLIGNKPLLQERMSLFGKKFTLLDFQQDTFQASGYDENTQQGYISCIDVALKDQVKAGVLNANNAEYVLATLDLAIKGCQEHYFDAMVTAPISKSVICQQGLNFTGHTEYLQEKTNTKEVVMMLGCAQMNVALATTHLPLKEVSAALTLEKLCNIITVLHQDLKQRFGFSKPCIYICGINPHAGEDGTLGKEEQDTLIPLIKELTKNNHMDLRGPLPADTIFQPKYLDEASAILTMYHDQGLPVLKYVGFEQGYNTTLGLPFIRTSVDHGTALDLAGKAKADPGSLLSAVSLALYMAHAEHNDNLSKEPHH